MSYYRTCPHCGAHLDPGESCDCRADIRDQLIDEIMELTPEERSLLLKSWKVHQQHPELTTEECIERAALGAANTKSGKVEHGLAANVSTSTIAENAEVCKL